MPKSNKANRPRSEADVDRAYRRACATMATVTLLIMKDKFNADDEHIEAFAHWLEVYMFNLEKGRISVTDCERALAGDYELQIKEDLG